MDFRLDDDQRQLQQALRHFCDNAIKPKAAERDTNGCFEEGLREQVAEMGLFGLYVPEEYGGAGSTMFRTRWRSRSFRVRAARPAS